MNSIFRILEKLDLVRANTVKLFHPRVRDNENIKVFRCEESEIIFLSVIEQARVSTYKGKKGLSYWHMDLKEKLPQANQDDIRRSKKFVHDYKDKVIADVGCGFGGFLRQVVNSTKESIGVEPQPHPRELLTTKERIKCYEKLDSLEDNYFDTIFLFHVFEHLIEPLQSLRILFDKLKVGGKIVIEVPHAKDALITLYESNAFKDFTFWSEHILLHTQQSLKAFLTQTSFKDITVEKIQRYPLSNHLYWLAKKAPGGHEKWANINDSQLNKEYEKTLAQLDRTDTLIATAFK